MKRAIIGCSMIKKDIEPIIKGLGYEYELIWLDETLHNTPQKLHDTLQETIDSLSDCDEIILTYLLCGNALVGIKSDHSELRFLKGDDCICACMSLREDYKQLRTSAIFLSSGWLSSQRSPLTEYDALLQKYGEKRTKTVYNAMYRNYKNIVYMKMDEKEKLTAEEKEKIDQFSAITGLEPRYLEGSVELYRKLLELEDDERVVHIEKGHEIGIKDTGIFG